MKRSCYFVNPSIKERVIVIICISNYLVNQN
uniref:Uncharacterized protein n=1 Tax=Lepeophtheirus salmonis TaxID=72036 RepID=A0A0K2UTP4_LEPSM